MEVYDENTVHTAKAREVTLKMHQDEVLYDVAELFKVFGDTTRTKIICALFENEMCVCDLTEAVGMTQSAVSHQLRILRQARLVLVRREGKSSYYSLGDNHVKRIFALAVEHTLEP
ncbi:MAG: metalloregulator ArsR/SmtB family transcription factor [Clostridiales bacterium]|nr:metalloregulator ArsR/SmtB family transcription factor [Clostridiales bacterium]